MSARKSKLRLKTSIDFIFFLFKLTFSTASLTSVDLPHPIAPQSKVCSETALLANELMLFDSIFLIF